jgi:putative ABC transport system permease protein
MLSARIAYRNLPRRKTRSILTVTAVILGVALLVGINMATVSAQSEFSGYINKFWGQTDIVVRYSAPVKFGSFPFQNVTEKIVANVTGVHQTAQRLEWAGSMDNRTYFQLAGVAGTDFDFASLNITGSRVLSSGQAVVSSTLALKYGLALGSTVTVFTPVIVSWSPFESRNVTVTVRVVGVDHPLRNLGLTVYVYLPDLQTVTGLQGQITRILATADDPTRAPVVRDLVQDKLPLEVTAPKAEAAQRIQGQMAGFQLGLNVMVGVALVVCAFIVFNTFFMSVSERTYEIGVMRAVGTSRRQVFDVFLGEGLILAFVGGTIGLFVGLGLSRIFTRVAEVLLGIPSLPLSQLTPYAVLLGLSAGVGSVAVGVIYPALSASRVSIVQAIRPGARDRTQRVPDSAVAFSGIAMLGVGSVQAFRIVPFHIPYLDTILIPIGLVVLGALVFGRTGRFLSIPVRPLSRGVVYLMSRGNRRRLVRNTVCFGMIAVTLSFVIMLGGIQSGVQVAVEQGIKEALGADIFLVANQSIPITFTNQLENIPQVSTATPLGFSTVSSKAFGPTGKTSNIGILAVDPFVFPSVIAYNFVNSPTPDQAYQALAASNQSLLMPDSLSNKTGVVVGDTLNVTISTGGSAPFKVAGIFNGPVLQYLQFGESFASDSIVVSFKSQQQYFGGEMSAPIFLVNLKPEYKAQVSSVAHDIATTYPNYDLAENSVTLSELLSLVRTTIDRIFVLILLVLYFALLIATLGIGATMIMNVADRRREIGLLRSQGVSRGQMLGMFLGEGLVLGIFGFLLAIPGGLLLLKGATNSTTIAGFWLPFIVPWAAMAEALPLAMAAVLVGSLYPAYRASRMEITEALEHV